MIPAAQRFLHSFEEGRAGFWIACLLVLLLLVSTGIATALRLHQGPASERAFLQATTARALAQGEGFRSAVLYPRTVAVLEERKLPTDPSEGLPELFHEPLYPLYLSKGLGLLSEQQRRSLFAPAQHESRTDPGAYNGDFYLLAANGLLFLLCGLATATIGWRLRGRPGAALSGAAFFLSYGLWQQFLQLDGSFLPALILLMAAHAFLPTLRQTPANQNVTNTPPPRLDRQILTGVGWGLLAALLWLGTHASWLLCLWLLCLAILRTSANTPVRRTIRAIGALLAFAALTAPWMDRQIELTGHPFGLALEGWREAPTGDSSFVPASRNRLQTDLPGLDGLKHLRYAFSQAANFLAQSLPAQAGWLFMALFALSLLHRPRDPRQATFARFTLQATLLTLLIAPFMAGNGGTTAAVTMVAPLILTGASLFTLVLLQSLFETPRQIQRAGLFLLLLQGTPLASALIQPAPPPYRFPPYYPGLFGTIDAQILSRRPAGLGIMADIPAGLAWYGQMTVWSQPEHYADFRELRRFQIIDVQLISPQTLQKTAWLNSPLLSPQTPPTTDPSWELLFRQAAAGRIPAFHPLRQMQWIQGPFLILAAGPAER